MDTTIQNESIDLGNNVSILSYNILAECYTIPQYFPYTEPQYLKFQYRSQKITQIIIKSDPDFITLQECDNFWDYYQPFFIKHKQYETIYTQRPNRGDGLMIGFRRSKYSLKYKEDISFDEIAKYLKCDYSWFRQSIAIICEFTNIKTGEPIIIVSTHLYWDPKFEHVKYHQMLTLVEIINIKYGETDFPILFTGDFNMIPESNAVQFLLNKSAPEKSNIENLTPEIWNSVNMEFQQIQDKCDLFWKSSYQQFRSDERHPEFTCYTKKWAGTIDYIFYRDNKRLRLQNLLDLPTLEQVMKETSLPNMEFPSDHLPIMAKFQLTNQND